MNKLTPTVFTIFAMLISGCTVKDKVMDLSHRVFSGYSDAEESAGESTKELTGMLQVIDPAKCPLSEGCGPRFSLLGRDLISQIAVEGEIDPAHKKLILSVVGRPGPLPDHLVGKSGYENIKAIIKIDTYRLRSSVPYYPFLVEQATSYTTQYFGCDLLWDKTYSWTIEQNTPMLSVKLTDTFATAPQSWVELTYNGNSGELLKANSSSPDINPCN